MSIIFSEGMGEKVKGKDEKEEEKNKLEFHKEGADPGVGSSWLL